MTSTTKILTLSTSIPCLGLDLPPGNFTGIHLSNDSSNSLNNKAFTEATRSYLNFGKYHFRQHAPRHVLMLLWSCCIDARNWVHAVSKAGGLSRWAVPENSQDEQYKYRFHVRICPRPIEHWQPALGGSRVARGSCMDRGLRIAGRYRPPPAAIGGRRNPPPFTA
jgi:hypothetical protein